MTDTPYLLKAADIDAMSGTAKTHFLNPNAQRVNKSLGDATGLRGFGFHLIEVAPGAETTEYHRHFYEDECVFVLSGTAEADIGDDTVGIGPGDFIGYPKGGLAHTIRNTGSETFRCIVVGERLDHDVADYPRQKKRIFRNKGMDWTLADLDALEAVGGSVGKK